MQLTGHKTRSVFERYNIVSEGDLFDAAKRLNFAAGTLSDAPANLEPKEQSGTVQQVETKQRIAKCAPVAQVDRATVS